MNEIICDSSRTVGFTAMLRFANHASNCIVLIADDDSGILTRVESSSEG